MASNWGLALGLLGAGALSSAASVYTNSQNQKFQDETNKTSIELANTAHQREVADLKAAGLNPVLSASTSGSSVPTLTSPQWSNPGEGLSKGISSAVRAAALEAPKTEAQIGLTQAQQRGQELANTALTYEAALAQAKASRLGSLLDVTAGGGTREQEKFDELLKEGIWSDAKNAANSNWRGNLRALGPVLNSAATVSGAALR